MIYEARLVHVRRERLDRRFRNRIRPWLVDLDALPRWPGLATFDARDHLGHPDHTIRQNLAAFLARHGIELTGCRVLMLALPRTLGYVFNPLTVYWCFDADGAPVCVVAEVHNTYGERHCYLLAPNAGWQATTAKKFYVSPFIPVDGEYRMRLPPPGDRLALSIVLHRDGRPVFTATLTGRNRGPATLRQAARHALTGQAHRVRALIQRHGIELWLRRLPVVPRRPHVHQEGVR